MAHILLLIFLLALSGEQLVRFGEFVLDPAKRTLSHSESPLFLTRKAFAVLLFLVQNPNRLVSKEELLQSCRGDLRMLCVKIERVNGRDFRLSYMLLPTTRLVKKKEADATLKELLAKYHRNE